MGGKGIEYQWVCCPQCGKKLIRRYADTHVQSLHLHCKHCKVESVFDF